MKKNIHVSTSDFSSRVTLFSLEEGYQFVNEEDENEYNRLGFDAQREFDEKVRGIQEEEAFISFSIGDVSFEALCNQLQSHYFQAQALVAWGKAQGFDVSYKQATTGTVYVTFEKELEDEDGFYETSELKIRFADHGECYCSEDFSVDPDGVLLATAAKHVTAFYAE